MRSEQLRLQKDHLVHAVHRLEPGTIFSMLCEMPRLLPEYSHTVVHETPLAELNTYANMTAQAQGLGVIQFECLTDYVLGQIPASGMVLYDIKDRPKIGMVRPSVYYAYSYMDCQTAPSIALASSAFMCERMAMHPDSVMPPFLDTRALRQVAGQPGPYTVAVTLDDPETPYSHALVNMLVEKLPPEIRLLVTAPKQARYSWSRPGLTMYPAMHSRATGMLAHADVVIVTSACAHEMPYSYAAAEAMALGKPVLCPDHGFFKHEFDHLEQVFMYRGDEDCYGLLRWVMASPDAAARVAANGKMWASWQDSGIQVGKFKRILRAIGT